MDFAEIALNLFATIVGVGAAVAASTLLETVRLRKEKPSQITLKQRINKLTNALQDATKLISEVESEVKHRETLANKLRQDVELYEQVASVKRREFDAITQVFKGELTKDRRRAFWENVALNTLFFVLGVVATLLLT